MKVTAGDLRWRYCELHTLQSGFPLPTDTFIRVLLLLLFIKEIEENVNNE
jgi:hypothetical protein